MSVLRLFSSSSSLVGFLLLVMLVGASGGGFFLLLAAPHPQAIDVGAPSDARYIDGFFRSEHADDLTFRWSSPDSRLLLYGAGAGSAVLSLRLHSDAPATHGRQDMQVGQGDQFTAHFALSPGWRSYHLLLPPGAATGPGFAARPVPLTSSKNHPDSRDRRNLGAPLDWVALQPLDGLPAPAGVPVQRALLLVWGVGVLAGAFWLLNNLLEPRRSLAAELHHLALQIAAAALILALWIWRSPSTLAWTWHDSPRYLAVATVVVAGALLVERLVGRALRRGIARLAERAHRLSSFCLRVGRGGLLAWLLPLDVVAHLVMFLPLPVEWRGSAAWVVVGVPGALLLPLLLCSEERDTLAHTFTGLCGALLLPPLLLLPIHALPGVPPWWLLPLAADLLALVGVWVLWRERGSAGHEEWHAGRGWPLLAVLLVGALIRLLYLGSAEFQGDEAQVMLLAAGVRHGNDDILMLHRKGPMEILFVAVPLVITSHTHEWVARLPFALAGVGNLLGVYLLATRMFRSAAVGLVAAGVLALEGFLIGFSRIVQYQNVVVLMTIAALWCCWCCYERGSTRSLVLAAAFAAVALLSHYDGIFGLPAMAWLVVAGSVRHGWGVRAWVGKLRLPLLVGGGLLLSFYLPFVLHEHFHRTFTYLVDMRVGDRDLIGLVFNNLVDYYHLASFYNTTFEVKTLAAVLATAFFSWLWVYGHPRWVGRGLALLLLAGCLVTLWNPAQFEFNEELNWAIIAFGLPVVGLALSPSISAHMRAVVIWFGVPFIAEAFLIADPNTHFYTMHAAAAVLVGLFVVQSVRWLRARRLGWVLSPLALWSAALLLLALPYIYLVFLRQSPEYERFFPEWRPGIYIADYGDETPRGSYFGFPHRDGWKAVEVLYQQGVFQGTYNTNQKEVITTWYVRSGERAVGDATPDYYFGVRAKGYFFIPKRYHLNGSIYIDGIRMMDIYSPALVGEQQVFHLHNYAPIFNQQPVPDIPFEWERFQIMPHKTPRLKELEELQQDQAGEE